MKRVLVFLMTLCMLMGLCSMNVWAEDDSGVPQAEKWKEETLMPYKLMESCSGAVGDKIYIIGGSASSGTLSENVKIYNTRTKVWETGASMPMKIDHSRSVTIGENIYVMGTYPDSTSAANKLIQVYNTKTNAWTSLKHTKDLSSRFSIVSVGSEIYLMNDGKLDIFDTITGAWKTGLSMPKKITGASAEVIGENIYVIGGEIPGESYPNKIVYIYNTKTDTWSEGAPMLTPRMYLTTAIFDSKIYAMVGNDGKGNIVNAVEVYDVVTNTWTSGVPTSLNKQEADSAVVNGKIYLIGGFNLSTGRTNFIESLQVGIPEAKLLLLLNVGETVQLSITNHLTDNTTLTWSSSNEAVAAVDAKGIVIAASEGTTEIYAKNADGTFKDCIYVKVVQDGSADETRLATHLKQGDKIRLYLSDDPSQVKWKSMDESVATVSESGQVTAVKKGLVIIQGEFIDETYLFYVRVVNT